MPVSRRTTEGLAADIAAVYGHAEIRLLSLMARHLRTGADSPRWVESKLAELQVFRRQALRVTEGARGEATRLLADALEQAYLRGAAAGQGDAEDAGVDTDTPPRVAQPQVAALVRAQADQLEGLDLPVVRQATDAYRAAVVRAAGGTLTGAATRLQDAQQALDDLARRGVSGFTDKAGRRWGLRAYVEMATRTTTAQAAVQGHLDRLEDVGLPLVIVSNSSRECETCRPWEGKVLSRGPVSAIMRDARTGEAVRVDVDATVDEATRGGLFHPNCTHNLSAYLPGVTRRDNDQPNAAGYEAQQRQRAMERKVREWKRREAASLTPEAQRSARAKVREWQGAIDRHTKAHDLPRKRNRESLTATR